MEEKEWFLERIDHSCFSRPTLPQLRHIISDDPRIKKYYPCIESSSIEEARTDIGFSTGNSGAENKWNHLRQEESLFYKQINNSTDKPQGDDTNKIKILGMESSGIESPEIDGLFDEIMNCLDEDETIDFTSNEPKSALESSRQKLKNLLNKSPVKNVIENPFLANTGPSNLLNKAPGKNVIENPFLANTEPSSTVAENAFLPRTMPSEAVIENPFLSTTGPTETHVKNSFISNATSTGTIENSYSSNTGSSQVLVENPFLSSHAVVENPFLSVEDSKKLFDKNNHEKLDKFRSSHDRVKSLLANVNLPPELKNFRDPSSFEESLRGKKNTEQSLRKQDISYLGATLPLGEAGSFPRETSFERELRGLKAILRESKSSTTLARSRSRSKSPRKRRKRSHSRSTSSGDTSRDRLSGSRIYRKQKASRSRSRSRSTERKKLRKRSRSKTPYSELKTRFKNFQQKPTNKDSTKILKSRCNSPVTHRSTSRDRLARPRVYRKRKTSSSRSRSRSRSSERKTLPEKKYSELQNRWRSTQPGITKSILKPRSRSRSLERQKLRKRSRSKTPYSESKNRCKSFQEKQSDIDSKTKLTSRSHLRPRRSRSRSREKFRDKSKSRRYRSKSPSGADNKRRLSKSKSLSPPRESTDNKLKQLNEESSNSNKLQIPSFSINYQPPTSVELPPMTPVLPPMPPIPPMLIQTPMGPIVPMQQQQPMASFDIPSTSCSQETELPSFNSDGNYLRNNSWKSTKKKKKIPHEDIYCDVCNVFVNTETQYNLHVRSKKHKKKEELIKSVRRNGGILPTPAPVPQVKLSCEVCQKYNFQTVDSYNNHMMSIKHLKNFTATLNEVSEIKLFNPEQQSKTTAVESFQKYSENVFANEAIAVQVKKKNQIIENHCQLCDVTVNSEEQFEMHLISKGHRKKLSKVNKSKAK
ncbi:uncharacterized protein LOC123301765 isoform X2 [Chrysoperla carnea]|uniref:uncharacterized protein LOC123301765 isoform X2 n=1 Tax=Chrysoperla carnea TaxID=189513 RepID=UPI001D08D9C8|nr:uncharacterized protein LOC123301765 isoform X2 [Chrysoperla carnea]